MVRNAASSWSGDSGKGRGRQNDGDPKRESQPSTCRATAPGTTWPVRRLVQLGARIGIDFQAYGDFDDARCHLLHCLFPPGQTGRSNLGNRWSRLPYEVAPRLSIVDLGSPSAAGSVERPGAALRGGQHTAYLENPR